MISAILPVSTPAAAFSHLGKSLESGLEWIAGHKYPSAK